MSTAPPVNRARNRNPSNQRGAPPGARGGVVSAAVKMDPKNPVPLEMGGSFFASDAGSFYIPFLTARNDLAQQLLEASLLSPTQNACIGTKTNYCVGEGLIAGKNTAADNDQVFKDWLLACNARRQSMQAVIRKYFGSFFRFGNVPIEIVCGKAGDQKYVYVYVKNMLECRKAPPPAGKPQSEAVVISKRFRKRNSSIAVGDSVTIPIYKRGAFTKAEYWLKKGNTQRTMLWVQNETDGYDEYGLPSSFAAFGDQILEYEGTRYNLDLLENNMVVGGAVVLEGSVTQPEINTLGRTIVNQHTGAGKRGRIAVFGSQQGISNSKFLKFETAAEGSYDKMDAKATKKIILANEWDATLAGLPGEGGSLGKGAGYMQEIYYQKMQTVIRPAQSYMLEQFISPLLEICDAWLGTQWSTYGVDIKPAQIVNKTSEASTSVLGLTAFFDMIKLISTGVYSVEAAIELAIARFGLTREDATAQIGTINVQPQQPAPGNANNGAGGNPAS